MKKVKTNKLKRYIAVVEIDVLAHNDYYAELYAKGYAKNLIASALKPKLSEIYEEMKQTRRLVYNE